MTTFRKSTGATVIILLTIVAYLPALRCGFIWDDDDYVTNNQALRSAEGLRQIWLNPNATVQYYPLTFTVFWTEYHLWGLQPLGFHLVNVLLQAANAVLFWRLLKRLCVPGAWWAAAVFALHPVHVMSVAWVTELKNVLSGFLFLAALLAYLRFCGLDVEHPVAPAGRRWFFGLALGLYVCALLSKSATSLLPVAVLLILWWKNGRLTRKDWLPVLPFFAMGIASGAFTLWLEKYAKGAKGQDFTVPFLERFLVAGHSFWFCLGKLVWPARLTFIYPRWQIDATSLWPYLFPLGAIAVLAALWWARRWVGRAPLAALVYFSLAFPALVMLQVLYMMRYSFVADHWQYLGSMSVIPLGVGGAVIAVNRWSPTLRRAGAVIGAVVLAVLGLLTWRQAHVYQDLETLWRDTIAKNPNAWLAYNNLATVLGQAGRVPEAIENLEESLRIKPDYAEAHYNLGKALSQEGKLDKAVEQYEQTIRSDPKDAEAHYTLGNTFLAMGRTREAAEHWEQAIRIKPDYAEAYNNLGAALAQAGRLPEAIEQFDRVVQLTPDDAEAHYNLAAALEQAGRIQEAIGHYEQALQLKPDYAEAQKRLAALRARQAR